MQLCLCLVELDILQCFVGEDILIPILIPVIPSLCRRLRTLRIDFRQPYGSQLSVLLSYIKEVGHNGITELHLGKDTRVSDAALHTIAELFPRLFTFAAIRHQVSYPVVCELILSGKLTAKRVKLDRGQASLVSWQLQSEGIHHKLWGGEIWLPL